MEEKSECKDCKAWEEEMYWTHFNSLRFFLTLPPYFRDHLVLPEKFASHMKVQLPDKVSLKAPSGAVWEVDVLKSDGIIFVGNEWKDFVKAINMKENSLLMFKYDRNSSFEVLIFDQESSCEREGSYFLKKCRHSKSDQDDQNKKTATEASSTELIEDDYEEDDVFEKSKKSRKDDGPGICSEQNKTTATEASNTELIEDDYDEDDVFVKSKKNREDDGPGVCSEQNKKTATEAPSTELIEDDYEEGDVFVKSKKRRKDDGPGACSGLKANTVTPMKRVLQAAAKGRDRPRSHESSIVKKPIRNDTGEKLKQKSLGDVITAEKGESLPTNDHSHKSKAQSKKSLDKSAASMGLSHNTREFIISDSSEYCHKLKGQSENQLTEGGTANEPSPILKIGLINIGNEDSFQAIVHSHQSKDQSEKRPGMNDTSKELSQNVGKELIIHENGDDSPVTDCSQKVKGRVDTEQSASETVKEAIPISWLAPHDRESSPKEDHSGKSGSKRSRQKKKGLHECLKNLVFKNASGQKKCSSGSEKISIRRPVTEEEKGVALQRAIENETENSFTAVMRATSVYRRFFLNIPSKWPHKPLLHCNQDVILRVGEKTWLTTFGNYGSGRGLYHGWKRFALDNNLEEFDVLVFIPVCQKVGAAIVMDVHIFRVV